MAATHRFDAHVHVWGPPSGHTATMLGAGGRPLPAGDPARLTAALDAAGVAGACVVQPACYGFDHAFVQSVIEAAAGRLVGCALADPSGPPASAAARAAALLDLPGRPFASLRFNPYLWPGGAEEALADGAGLAMAAAAGERGAPVCVMAFKGLVPLVTALRRLAAACPATPLVLDHCGFAGVGREDEVAALCALAADFPNMHVKLSALFRLGGGSGGYDPWPHAAVVAGPARAALAAFGPRRVMAGTDWPWVTDVCGYGDAWAALEGVWEGWDGGGGDWDEAAARAGVEGGNAARLFGWGGRREESGERLG